MDSILMSLNASQATVAITITALGSKSSKELPDKSIPDHWVGLKQVVGGVLLCFCVIKNVVSINGPLASNPSVELFVKHAFLGQLEIDVVLRWNFVSRRLAINLMELVLVVGVSDWCTKCSHLAMYQAIALTWLF